MATIPAPAEVAPAPAKGKKKLILIAALSLLVLALVGGGAAFWLMQKKASAAAEADGDEGDTTAEAQPHKKKGDKQHLPVFLPMDMFTVNLADREAERYAQVGVTLELADTKTSDLLKAYMPAVRNDVLMLIAHKKASELQDREGKLELAREIRRAAMKPLDDADDNTGDESPVRAVHFSSFIIQ
ncbi:MAG: flagellar basal body-associated FliL family protein [Burkholderiales bacterium]|jgi:flagellar FliL protein